MEGVLVSFAAEVDGLEGGEDTVDGVLPVGVEGWPDGGGVLGLFDSGGFFSVAQVGVVGGSPLVLPAHVVGVARRPAYLAETNRTQQRHSRLTS